MKKIIFILISILAFSCQDEYIEEFETQLNEPIQEVNTPQPSPTFKLHKESYLNQRSGITFWWYDGRTHLNVDNGYFGGGQAYHDVNGDGFQDILVTHHLNDNESFVKWFINDGKNEKFTPSTNYINGDTKGLNSHRILKTDVNNDGLADFILLGVDERVQGDYTGNFTVLIGKVNGTFDIKELPNPERYWFHNGSAGDLDGDGFVDVITQGLIWIGDGKGNFTNSNINLNSYFTTPDNSILVYEIADFDKDGWNDVYLGSAPIRNPNVVILNNKGVFNQLNKKIELPFDSKNGIYDIGIYDIDGDTDLDIIEYKVDTSTDIGKLFTYINNELTFTYVPNYIQNSEDGGFLNGSADRRNWGSFKFDDLDGDGKDEIVVQNFHDGYNPHDNNLVYNCLKKVDGVWKKTFIKLGK
jgi:hypothetical protein